MKTLLLFCLALAPAFAAPVEYAVTVDTSSLAGVAGSLDFQFNPGPLTTQPAFVQILDFTSSGAFAPGPQITGNVSGGPLPADLTIDNGTAFNDYFAGFTFGSTLSFLLNLSGPALSAPDGTSTSGSAFAFSMFSDAAGTIPALTTDQTDGFAFIVNVNLDGTTTVTNFSQSTGLVQTPEPQSLTLAGIFILSFLRFGSRRS